MLCSIIDLILSADFLWLMRSNFYPLDFTAEVRYNISTRKVVWYDHILLINKSVVSLKNLLAFTTTFHPTDRNVVGGNNGEKMLKDDILAEQKAL